MKMKTIIIAILSAVLLLSGCKDLFEPELRNNRQLEDAYSDPIFFQGILGNGYVRIPTNAWVWSDLATDNAVSRDVNNGFYRMAQGEWAANNNPLSMWNQCYTGIQFMNMVLDAVDKSEFARNDAVNVMFQDRSRGEALALRALFMYHLLQNHAGVYNGQLLGVPIVTTVQDVTTDFNQPRPTFEACVQQIYNDVEEALKYLPNEYNDISDDSQVPNKYRELGANAGDYNRPFGKASRTFINGNVAKGIRAHTALLAASPAYNQNSGVSWEEAANYIAEVLDANNGLAGLDPNGLIWYLGSEIDAGVLGQGQNPEEIIWRGSMDGPTTNMESDNFPPTLYGRGLINPTQNLVDAFPMANGYPINEQLSGYDENNPYIGRDPRLKLFIIYNGATAGVGNTPIYTSIDGATNDGINLSQNATRTGYYLKKLLRQDVNLNPNSVNGQRHIKPRMRYTDFYLAYAEAANEAWGPTADGGHGYSAYDVVKAIRKRAGVGVANNDAYLETIKDDKNQMRTLIQNERRLELCFEGYRFWDLRRWNANLNETARGVRIEGGQFNFINVQERTYDNHMIYGPLPYGETIKFPNMEQNNGW